MADQFSWLAQEYVPLLQQWGEFRTFIVGGHIIDTLLTTKAKGDFWAWCIMNDWFSLEELK
jgi:hypothetical protein